MVTSGRSAAAHSDRQRLCADAADVTEIKVARSSTARRQGFIETGVTIGLVISILGMSASMVYDRFLARRFANIEPDSIEFVAQWESALREGLVIGDAGAPFQLVEFIDLQCPACRRFHSELSAVRDDEGADLTVTYVNLPLDYHATARTGAKGLICAHREGMADPFIEAAFDDQAALRKAGDTSWVRLASHAGIRDTARFKRCLADSTTASQVDAQIAIAKRLNVPATPTIILNGWQFGGAIPQRKFLRKFMRQIREGQHQPPPSDAGLGKEPT
jgi:hypothetical protein